MAKKCLPGIICIENVTLVLILCIILLCVYYYNTRGFKQSSTIINIKEQNDDKFFSRYNDVLLNPYSPPQRQNPFLRTISTNRGFVNSLYSQIGFLKSNTHKELMLPLFGRLLYSNRSKWQYYTLNDNGIKLPVSKSGKSCTGEYGCDELMNNENIYVEGYDTNFRATVYETNSTQYIPYI